MADDKGTADLELIVFVSDGDVLYRFGYQQQLAPCSEAQANNKDVESNWILDTSLEDIRL